MFRLAKKNYKKVLQYIGSSTSFGKPAVNIPAHDTSVQHNAVPAVPSAVERVSRDTEECEHDQCSQLQLASHLNLSLCYLKLGNNLKTLDSSDKALEIDPTNNKGLYRRGQVCQSLQNFSFLNVF